MTETPPQLIHCDLHGPSKYGIICTHLCEKNSLGYYAISAEEDEPAQAWCKDCDQVLESEKDGLKKPVTLPSGSFIVRFATSNDFSDKRSFNGLTVLKAPIFRSNL